MKVVFLDRDGVINEFPGNGNYCTKIKNFSFIPGALDALKDLTDDGYTIFVISNQAGVGKGVYTKNKLNRINQHMLKHVKAAGAKIKKAYYCIHRSDAGCECRKPEIGHIEMALKSVKLPMTAAKKIFFVGDTKSDIQTGHKAGCKTIFVLSGREDRRHMRKWPVKPDFIVKNLTEATKVIQHENSNHSRLGRSRARKSS